MRRRLLTVLLALAMFAALPVGAALAKPAATVYQMKTYEVSTGVAPDGALLAEGTYRFMLNGVVVEEGTTSAAYYVDATGTAVECYRTYTSPDGETVEMLGIARLVGSDEATGAQLWHTKFRQIGGSVHIPLVTAKGATTTTGTDTGFILSETAKWYLEG